VHGARESILVRKLSLANPDNRASVDGLIDSTGGTLGFHSQAGCSHCRTRAHPEWRTGDGGVQGEEGLDGRINGLAGLAGACLLRLQ
jgi:hypothetical protein